MVTNGLIGSVDDVAFVGVGVVLPVGAGVPAAGVGEGDASCGEPDKASLTTADNL